MLRWSKSHKSSIRSTRVHVSSTNHSGLTFLYFRWVIEKWFSLDGQRNYFLTRPFLRIRWSNREICNLCAIHWVNVACMACSQSATEDDGGRSLARRKADTETTVQGNERAYRAARLVHRPYIGQSRPKAASDPWKRWWGMNMNMPAAAAGFTGRVSVAGVTLMATI